MYRLYKVMNKLPVVVVLGATGAGKSKLALQLAQRYNGEIISTDSMQVYKGLDIVTNKVTKEERKLVPHHLIDFLSPLRSTYDVTQFRDAGVPLIENLLAKNKVPVIVGGTNYYIEALLWDMLIQPEKFDKHEPAVKKTRLSSSSDSDSSSRDAVKSNCRTREPSQGCRSENINVASGTTCNLNDKATPSEKTDSCQKVDSIHDDKFLYREKYNAFTSIELHEKLRQIDAATALRYHPNQRRKILTALQLYEERGLLLSEVYARQHSQEGSSKVSGPLRYPRTCVLWVQCQQTVLDERTDKRVDKMIEQGLLAELLDFHAQYNQQRLNENKDADYTRGVFQSIGFKEFHPYLILSEDERNSEEGKKMLQTGIEDMKRATRRYARRQVSWMRSRFLRRRGGGVPAVYAVDSSDADRWHDDVYDPAARVLEAILEGREPEQEALTREDNTDEPCYHVCESCGGRVFVSSHSWQAHLKSRKHKRRVERIRWQAKQESEKVHENYLTSCADPKQQLSGDTSVPESVDTVS